MVSNTKTASVCVRLLSAPDHLWAYEITEAPRPTVRGTVQWAGDPDLGLLSEVLRDYVHSVAASPRRTRATQKKSPASSA